MNSATVSEKGWIVIPKEIRDRYGLTKGKRVHVVDLDGTIYLIPALKDPIRDAKGMFEYGPSLTEGLLADRNEEMATEDRKAVTGIGPAKKSAG